MSPRRSCDSGPRRAVQNQAVWCTECHRRTARYRKRPRSVREACHDVGAAQAARRSGSEFAKRMSSGDARRRHRRSPRTRTPLNGLTKKSASADRRGRGTLQRKVEKRLERRRSSGMCPVKKEASPFWASLLVRNRLQELFLASLVSLVEHINSAGAVDYLHLAGVERVRCV